MRQSFCLSVIVSQVQKQVQLTTTTVAVTATVSVMCTAVIDQIINNNKTEKSLSERWEESNLGLSLGCRTEQNERRHTSEEKVQIDALAIDAIVIAVGVGSGKSADCSHTHTHTHVWLAIGQQNHTNINKTAQHTTRHTWTERKPIEHTNIVRARWLRCFATASTVCESRKFQIVIVRCAVQKLFLSSLAHNIYVSLSCYFSIYF